MHILASSSTSLRPHHCLAIFRTFQDHAFRFPPLSRSWKFYKHNSRTFQEAWERCYSCTKCRRLQKANTTRLDPFSYLVRQHLRSVASNQLIIEGDTYSSNSSSLKLDSLHTRRQQQTKKLFHSDRQQAGTLLTLPATYCKRTVCH